MTLLDAAKLACLQVNTKKALAQPTRLASRAGGTHVHPVQQLPSSLCSLWHQQRAQVLKRPVAIGKGTGAHAVGCPLMCSCS
jgi:hypothetical protein